MTAALNDVLTAAGALVLVVPTLGCDSPPAGFTFGRDAGAGGAISAPDAGSAGATSDLDSGTAGAAFDPDAKGAKPGPYAVGHVNYMLADTAVYDRTVAVSVWYPVDSTTITAATLPAEYRFDPWSNNLPASTSTDWEALGYDPAYEGPTPSAGGPFPLVMHSPGWGCDNQDYTYIGTRLASHGLVVAITDHSGDGQYSWSPPRNALVVAMLNRNRDVSFAITELLVKNDASGELLQGVIDPSSIAASGHSLGGYTAYALAGGDDELCDALWATNYAGDSLPEPQFTCVPAPSDPRIRAVVSLDGSSQLLRYQELARISVPSLIMGETVEHVSGYNSMPADPNLGRFIARPHAAVNRSDSPRVDVTTANHVSFTNWCDELKIMSSLGVDTSGLPGNGAYPCVAQNTFDPANNPATRQIVTTYMLAFLNTQFGRADDAWMLTADYAAQNQPLVEFFDSEACDAPLPSTAYYTYRPHAGACQVAQQDPPDYFAP